MNAQKLALVAIRLFGIANIAIGVAWLVVGVGLSVAIFHFQTLGEYMASWMGTWTAYGLMNLVAGIVVLLFAPRLAAFAAESE
jgi:hypothetical protein